MPMYDSLADHIKWLLLEGATYRDAPNLGADVLDCVDTLDAKGPAMTGLRHSRSPKPPMPPPRRWASRRKAADDMGRAERTLDQWVADGHITAYWFEGLRSIRFGLNEIDASLNPSSGGGERVMTAPEGAVVSNVIMGETGEPQRKIEIIPAPRPARRRRDTPTPAPAPQPTREPEREPAHR